MQHLYAEDSLPWVCIGDFNEILAPNEKIGDAFHNLQQMKSFKEVIQRCGLVDVGFVGESFKEVITL